VIADEVSVTGEVVPGKARRLAALCDEDDCVELATYVCPDAGLFCETHARDEECVWTGPLTQSLGEVIARLRERRAVRDVGTDKVTP
jgi:hypothetical protein